MAALLIVSVICTNVLCTCVRVKVVRKERFRLVINKSFGPAAFAIAPYSNSQGHLKEFEQQHTRSTSAGHAAISTQNRLQ